MFDLEDAKRRGCTYDGRNARVLSTDLRGEFPVALAVDRGEGELLARIRPDGRGCGLINAVNLPREVTVWIAANEVGGTAQVAKEADAKRWADRYREWGSAAGYAPVTIKLTR